MVSFAVQKILSFIRSHLFIIVYFPTPKTRSIFGLHREQPGKTFRLGSDWVACIRIYVPMHGLSLKYIFVAKSEANVANLLATVIDVPTVTNVTKTRVTARL